MEALEGGASATEAAEASGYAPSYISRLARKHPYLRELLDAAPHHKAKLAARRKAKAGADAPEPTERELEIRAAALEELLAILCNSEIGAQDRVNAGRELVKTIQPKPPVADLASVRPVADAATPAAEPKAWTPAEVAARLRSV